MHVLITGATGFIGSHLLPALQKQGTRLSLYVRNKNAASRGYPYAGQVIDNLQDIPKLPPIDAVINLAGAPIADWPWTKKRRQKLWHSRIHLTHRLVEQLKAHDIKTLINGSAIGYYGTDLQHTFTEESSPVGQDFSQELCYAWEQEALKCSAQRICLLRTGVVLGHGGLYQKLKPSFALGLGAILGNGEQWFSWIHINDMVNAICFCLNQSISGAVNCTAPNPVKQKEFAKAFAQSLHRPQFLRIPQFALKPVGDLAKELLLAGQKVVPQKLIQQGYTFTFAHLNDALADLT